jgi:hypothetical protein
LETRLEDRRSTRDDEASRRNSTTREELAELRARRLAGFLELRVNVTSERLAEALG